MRKNDCSDMIDNDYGDAQEDNGDVIDNDSSHYPRDLQRDADLCNQVGDLGTNRNNDRKTITVIWIQSLEARV